MLSSMRQGKFIKVTLWIVVVAFVATMVFVWGADLEGISCDPTAPQGRRWVGMVAKQGLSLQDFNQRVQLTRNQLLSSKQEGQVLTHDEQLRIGDQVFDQMVKETLFAMEAKRLGLEPSDEEIAHVLQHDPPDFLRSQFTDEQGRFNEQAYLEVINNEDIDWPPIEDRVRRTLPLERLDQMIAASVHVNEGEVRQEFERRFSKMQVRYIGKSWREIELENEEPGDELLLPYFEEHRQDYRVPERYRVKIVKFSRDPSPDDETFVLSRAQEIRNQVLAGGDFAELAKIYSEDNSNAENGGDLGWFDRGKMVPAFENAAFAMAVGEVSEPVRTQFGFHVIKKEEERVEEGATTEVYARHILLKVEPSYTTLDSMATLADSLYEVAKRDLDLAPAAATLGLELLEPKPFTLTEAIEGLGYNASIRAAIPRLADGEVSRRFTARDANYVIQRVETLPEGDAEFAEVRERLRLAWIQDEKKRQVREQATALLALVEGEGLNLSAAAERLGLEPTVTEEFTRSDYIPDVGSEGPFQHAAYLLNARDISGIIETSNGAFVIEVMKKIESDKGLYEGEREKIREELRNRSRQVYFESWVEQLENRYEVEDWREALYGNNGA